MGGGINFILLYFGMYQSLGSAEARPQWVTHPENVNAMVGDDVCFKCSFIDLGEGGPSPRWDHRGSIFRMISKGNESYDPRCEITGDFSSGEYNVLIRNITFEDAGEWQCSQVEAVPQAQKATLTVMEKEGEESGSQITASPSYSARFSSSSITEKEGEESRSQIAASPSYSARFSSSSNSEKEGEESGSQISASPSYSARFSSSSVSEKEVVESESQIIASHSYSVFVAGVVVIVFNVFGLARV